MRIERNRRESAIFMYFGPPFIYWDYDVYFSSEKFTMLLYSRVEHLVIVLWSKTFFFLFKFHYWNSYLGLVMDLLV